MDPFANLNFFYPGIRDITRLHTLRSPEVSLEHPLINSPATALCETHPRDAHLRLGSSKTTRTRPVIVPAGHMHNARYQRLRPQAVRRDFSCLETTNPNLSYMEDECSDSSDRYVPSSHDKLTCSDHRPLDEIFGQLHVSPQIPTIPILLGRDESIRSGPSSASVITYALPTKPQLDGVVQIPLLAVDNGMKGTNLVVTFNCSDWGIGVPIEGIPMMDLLRGDYSEFERPHERVLDGFGLTNLRLNILWPNYSPFAKTISALGLDGKPLTRAGLGYEVALAFAEFYCDVHDMSTPFAVFSRQRRGHHLLESGLTISVLLLSETQV